MWILYNQLVILAIAILLVFLIFKGRKRTDTPIADETKQARQASQPVTQAGSQAGSQSGSLADSQSGSLAPKSRQAQPTLPTNERNTQLIAIHNQIADNIQKARALNEPMLAFLLETSLDEVDAIIRKQQRPK